MTDALTWDQVKWAHQKWCEGHSIEQIADALFVCRKTLYRAFKRYGMNRKLIPLVYPGHLGQDPGQKTVEKVL